MKRIFKYQLELVNEQTVQMPEFAVIISAQAQHRNGLCLWAMVDDGNKAKPVTIRIIGTGHPIPDAGQLYFISTVQQEDLVWHVFQKP